MDPDFNDPRWPSPMSLSTPGPAFGGPDLDPKMIECPFISKVCHTCKTPGTSTESLQYCGRCKAPTILYCSRRCQVEDYKEHKKTCILNNKIFAFTGSIDKYVPKRQLKLTDQPDMPNLPGFRHESLEVTIANPFHRLRAKKWLRNRPEKDVFKLLIDVYRMRMEQAYLYGGFADDDGIYNHGEDGRAGLRRFLKLLESKPKLLPKWWSQSKTTDCVQFGTCAEKSRILPWSDLALAIRMEDVVEHYGDPSMPNQLRLFGEQAYGSSPGGTFDGMAMFAVHLAAEKG